MFYCLCRLLCVLFVLYVGAGAVYLNILIDTPSAIRANLWQGFLLSGYVAVGTREKIIYLFTGSLGLQLCINVYLFESIFIYRPFFRSVTLVELRSCGVRPSIDPKGLKLKLKCFTNCLPDYSRLMDKTQKMMLYEMKVLYHANNGLP